MSKKPRRRLEKYLVQPLVIRTVSRFVIALTVALLWKRLVASIQPLSSAFFLLAVVFFVFAWMAYLRADGVKLPKIDRKLFEPKKKPVIKYGDMSDYIDEEPDPFQDLDEEDHEFVAFLSNLITGTIYLILSFFRF